MSSDNCAVESVHRNGQLVIGFRDAKIHDESKIQEVSRALTACLTRAKNRKVLLNFANVQFMSSDMISKLVMFNRKCRTFGIHLELCNVPQNLLAVFRITRLDGVFQFYDGDDPLLVMPANEGVERTTSDASNR
jgi:anti-anti-sigma factor